MSKRSATELRDNISGMDGPICQTKDMRFDATKMYRVRPEDRARRETIRWTR